MSLFVFDREICQSWFENVTQEQQESKRIWDINGRAGWNQNIPSASGPCDCECHLWSARTDGSMLFRLEGPGDIS